MGSSSRSSFLVEASGDSDNININNYDHQDPHAVKEDDDDDDGDDDDDAGSCSCDVSDYYSCVSKVSYDQSEESSSIHVLGKASDEAEDDYEDEDEDEGEVLQKIHHLDRWRDSGNIKSCVSAESTTNETISDKEENRLFWEACLAS
ncbi:hypothetical protein M5689_003585 [Euphorbia peplus]|nr:hypothetical protein M5689_003585 [Euphorbia peplus]